MDIRKGICGAISLSISADLCVGVMSLLQESFVVHIISTLLITPEYGYYQCQQR